jgi:hypothetical protein
MRRALFAIAVAAVVFAAVSGASQSAPIAPLPAAIAHDTGDLTQVWWHHHHFWHRYHWHRWHHHCWRWRCW